VIENNRERLVLGPAECPHLRRPAVFGLRREGEFWLAENRALGIRGVGWTPGEAAESARLLLEFAIETYLRSPDPPPAAPDLARTLAALAALLQPPEPKRGRRGGMSGAPAGYQ